MWFVVRTAFWLSIVVMLLPTPESMKAPETNFGAAQAVSAASATVGDLREFCTRQPGACEAGSQALTSFGYKAQASAKWLYEFLSDKMGPDTASRVREDPKAAPVDSDLSQNTLTPADAAPAWRGPQRQAEARR